MTDHHLYLISHPMCNLAKILGTEYKIKYASHVEPIYGMDSQLALAKVIFPRRRL